VEECPLTSFEIGTRHS